MIESKYIDHKGVENPYGVGDRKQQKTYNNLLYLPCYPLNAFIYDNEFYDVTFTNQYLENNNEVNVACKTWFAKINEWSILYYIEFIMKIKKEN